LASIKAVSTVTDRFDLFFSSFTLIACNSITLY
jgi:hypothetical protein